MARQAARKRPGAPPSSRVVVLLRGVNVGKGNRVPMADFRAMLEEQGHSDVRTLLNSGNAVFAPAAGDPVRLAKTIAAAVEARFGVVTPVIVKSAPDFAAIVSGNPITPPETDHSRFLVAFAMDPGKLAELRPLEPLLAGDERLAITAHAAYLHCAGGLLESAAGKAILGKAGASITTRNWGTTLKLRSMLDAENDTTR